VAGPGGAPVLEAQVRGVDHVRDVVPGEDAGTLPPPPPPLGGSLRSDWGRGGGGGEEWGRRQNAPGLEARDLGGMRVVAYGKRSMVPAPQDSLPSIGGRGDGRGVGAVDIGQVPVCGPVVRHVAAGAGASMGGGKPTGKKEETKQLDGDRTEC